MKKETIKLASKYFLIILHIFGILFSISSMLLLVGNIFNIDIPIPDILNKNLILPIGTLIGLFFIGLAIIFLSRNTIEKRIGYFYFIFWIIAIVILLKVVLIDKS